MLRSINILGVKITSEPEEKVLEYVLETLKNSPKKFFITTPNPEILTYAHSHSDYRSKLNQAEIALPDGVGLLLAAKLMAKPLKQRITGTDFIEKLCEMSREPFFHQGKNPVSMGFLGGRGGVAERAAERLKSKYPWLNIVFIAEEWTQDARRRWHVGGGDEENNPRATRHAPRAIDILFVAYGFPKQEEWICKNLEKLPVKAAMGVGGAFDYISGDVMRAPLLIRKIGFEWLFRLIRQPWRWKRQLALIRFIWLVLKEKFEAK